jgi:geranylgeranyl diphosphate synthase type 3
LLRKKGKDIRPKLLKAFNVWLKVPDEKVKLIGDIIQMLHNSSLLVDDIQDNSVLRRGNPCAHKIYGVASTINSANYVYFIGLEKILELNNPEAVHIFKESMLELHRGQGMEIYWRDTFMCPTENEYRDMTVRKTGGLFNLAVKLMQLFSNNEDCPQYNYVELTSLLGLYFQIRDDYANLCLDEYFANKSFGEDLTEGKYNFPIVHAIQKYPKDNRLNNILRQRTQEIDVKKYAIKLLEDAGSFRYTRDQMRLLDNKIRAEIGKLNGNDVLLRVMDDLRNWDTIKD